MRFIDSLISSLEAKGTHLCVGLDSRYDRIPDVYRQSSVSDTILAFNRAVIDSTHDLAVAFKMNVAFYAGFGSEGLRGLELTNGYLQQICPETPRIADCKRSEMGDSVAMVRQELFDHLGFNCVMVTPWFGFDTVRDYLIDPSKGVSVYVHDSNPSASEFQDLEIRSPQDGRIMPLYEYVAHRVSTCWNESGNVFVEAGLTYPLTLPVIRRVVGPEMPMLVAGLGAQGGKAADLEGLFGKDRRRLMVNASRAIIFPALHSRGHSAGVRAAALQIVSDLRSIADK